MRVLQRLVERPHACAYLPERSASTEVLLMLDVSSREFQSLLERGWRRFGPCYFRPACGACNECISLRVVVKDFVPTRTQRRVEKKARALRRAVSVPTADPARVALYELWHRDREAARNWAPSMLDAERYALDFAFPHQSAREAAFFDGDRLVAVGLFDETPNALSATFCFYDPAYAPFSPGVANVLALLRDAKWMGKEFVYLGYHVRGCVSLEYKAKFRPHQLLAGRPRENESPVWVDGGTS